MIAVVAIIAVVVAFVVFIACMYLLARLTLKDRR